MSALVDPEELLTPAADVTLLDVRWELGRSDGYAQHLAGHLPGAAYVDLERGLADPPGPGGRHPLPAPERFLDAMRRAGVRRDRAVVVYDDVGGRSAARAWWLLRFYGHPNVRLLDGGLRSWVDLGGRVQSGAVSPAYGDFDGRPGHLPTVDAGGAAALAADGVLIDARAPERFLGQHEPVDPVAGHVPGAVNVPTARNLEEHGPRFGRFQPQARLAQVYAEARRHPDRVAVYCGSGITAAHDVLALHEAGVRAALYPGSWSEWVSDSSRPVANGA